MTLHKDIVRYINLLGLTGKDRLAAIEVATWLTEPVCGSCGKSHCNIESHIGLPTVTRAEYLRP